MHNTFLHITYIYVYVYLVNEKFYVIYLYIIECIFIHINEICLLYIPWIIFYYIYLNIRFVAHYTNKYKLSFISFECILSQLTTS